MRRLLIGRLLVGLLAWLLCACNLTAGTVTPTSIPDVPLVEFQYPVNGSSVVEGTEVEIQLLAQDALGDGIARVELLVDDQPHQEGAPVISSAVPVFTVEMSWVAQGLGLHSMSAVAFRADGTSGPPTTIRILVLQQGSTPEPE
jgi:hypothetical protein